MKIALASARTVDRDIAHNLSQLERYTKEAKAAGADLVCFGEAFLQGFNALSWQYEIDKTIALKRIIPPRRRRASRFDDLLRNIMQQGGRSHT